MRSPGSCCCWYHKSLGRGWHCYFVARSSFLIGLDGLATIGFGPASLFVVSHFLVLVSPVFWNLETEWKSTSECRRAPWCWISVWMRSSSWTRPVAPSCCCSQMVWNLQTYRTAWTELCSQSAHSRFFLGHLWPAALLAGLRPSPALPIQVLEIGPWTTTWLIASILVLLPPGSCCTS